MPTFKKDPSTRFAEVETKCDKPAYALALKSGGLRAGSKMRPDVTQKLAKLSNLHKSGELSDSEYAAAKKKLLG